MSEIDISQELSRLQAMAAAAQGQSPAKVDGGDVAEFGKLLQSAVDKVNETQQQAGKMAESFEKGDSQADLTEVMVALQKAKISFQAMVEVRNKLVVAYQDIMNMQI
jgi:flagellar hook-basal body complex protein FliE